MVVEDAATILAHENRTGKRRVHSINAYLLDALQTSGAAISLDTFSLPAYTHVTSPPVGRWRGFFEFPVEEVHG
jgi:hypothetical protein